jgi:hypothetical protein
VKQAKLKKKKIGAKKRKAKTTKKIKQEKTFSSFRENFWRLSYFIDESENY